MFFFPAHLWPSVRPLDSMGESSSSSHAPSRLAGLVQRFAGNLRGLPSNAPKNIEPEFHFLTTFFIKHECIAQGPFPHLVCVCVCV